MANFIAKTLGIKLLFLMSAADTTEISSVCVCTSVGSNLVRFGGSFGFLRFGRFEVRFLEVRKVRGSVFSGSTQH